MLLEDEWNFFAQVKTDSDLEILVGSTFVEDSDNMGAPARFVRTSHCELGRIILEACQTK